MLCWLLLMYPALVLADLNQRLKDIEGELEKIRQQSGLSEDTSEVSLYGALRPAQTLVIDDGESSSDLQDALSFMGIRGSTRVMDNSLLFFASEWPILLAEQGQLDGGRNVYAGLSGPYGKLTVGKQHPPQYQLIGKYVDIFHHGDSPFGYLATATSQAPNAGFNHRFADNSIQYQFAAFNVGIISAIKTDGRSGEDHADFINAGLYYSDEYGYLSYAYLDATAADSGDQSLSGDQMTSHAIAAYTHLGPAYLAAAYQRIRFTPFLNQEQQRSSVDVVMRHPFGRHYSLSAGYFRYHDDESTAISRSFKGINLTLEYSLASNAMLYTSLMNSRYQSQPRYQEWRVGLKYEFYARLR